MLASHIAKNIEEHKKKVSPNTGSSGKLSIAVNHSGGKQTMLDLGIDDDPHKTAQVCRKVSEDLFYPFIVET